MRRIWLIIIITGGCALAAALALALHYYSRPTTLKVAVGPPKGEDARLMAAIAGQLGRDRAAIRLRVVEKEGPVEAAAALDRSEVDLALVRRDLAMSATGQAVLVMRTSVVAILPLPGLTMRKIGDLAGQRVGMVGRDTENGRVLEAILRHYGVDPGGVRVLPVGIENIDATVRERMVDVVFVAAPVDSKEMTDAVMAIWQQGGAPSFVPIAEAEALEQRLPIYESEEILAGAFGGNPPQPVKSVTTIGFSHYLVGSNRLSEQTAGELARLLMGVRPAVAGAFPVANQIKGPDTDKDSPVTVHPGAAAYFDGEQKTFLERYSDFVYLGVMVVSLIASAAAALFGYGRVSERSASHQALLQHALDLMSRVRRAENELQLEQLQRENEDLLLDTLGQFATGQVDEASMRAITLALDHAHRTIADRRLVLSQPS